MHLSNYVDVAQYPRRVRWIMAGAWLLIVVKCVLVWWAVDHWHMAFHPLWVVGPTLLFAGLATGVWLTHHED
jgi:hypothetical protein